jgi:hypothetical protein
MSDSAMDESAVLLKCILQTLKQISGNISAQERRWDRIAEVLENFGTLPSRSGELRTAWSPLSSLTTRKDESILGNREPVATQRLQPTPSSETLDHNLGVPHFPPFETREENSITDYRSWRSPLENSPLHDHSFLNEELGDAWTIPDDGRLPLSFSREVLESLRLDQLRLAVSYIGKFRDRMSCSNEQRFHVIDYDGAGGNIVYRLGQSAVGRVQELKPMPKTKAAADAPWRRLV